MRLMWTSFREKKGSGRGFACSGGEKGNGEKKKKTRARRKGRKEGSDEINSGV